MATLDQYDKIRDKGLLGIERLTTYSFDYIKELLRDLASRVILGSGWFENTPVVGKVDIDITGVDQISIQQERVGYVSGMAGGFIYTAAGDTEAHTALKFPNNAAVVYFVTAEAKTLPTLVEANPRTGTLEYTRYKEFFAGGDVNPDAVADNGNGTLTATVNALFSGAGSHAGRWIRIWLDAPKTTTSQAFETRQVTWDGANHKITTTAKLGQPTISVVAADYQVALIGPHIRPTQGPGALIGKVTGAGVANPPASKDLTGQNLITAGIADLGTIVRIDAHGFPKIRVKADVSDSAEPQLEVMSSADVQAFAVTETGQAIIGLLAGAGTSALLRSAGGNASIQNDNGTLKIDVTDATKTVQIEGINHTSAADTTLDAGLKTNVVGAVNQAFTDANNKDDATLAPCLLTGGAVTDGGGLNATVATLTYVDHLGRYKTIAGANFSCNANANNYLFVDVSSATVLRTAGLPLLDAEDVLLALVVTGAASITSIIDVRLLANALPRKIDLLVGPAPTGHFQTVKAAVDAVSELMTPTSGTASLSYRILVVGNTTETASIVVKTHGLVIQGCGAGANATISWSGNFALFDLNGKDDLTFRDLAIKFTSNADDAGSIRRVAFQLTGISERCRFENLYTTATGTSAMHAVFWCPANTDGLRDGTIRDSTLHGASDYGVVLKDCSGTQVDGCKVIYKSPAAGNNQVVVGPGFWIGAGAATSANVTISSCLSSLWRGKGMKLDGALERFRIDKCHIKSSQGFGIHIEDADRGKVTDCDVEDVAIGVDPGYALYLDGTATRTMVSGNDLKCNAAMGVKDALFIGISCDFTIVTGNQQNGQGNTNNNVNSTLTGNRDDA